MTLLARFFQSRIYLLLVLVMAYLAVFEWYESAWGVAIFFGGAVPMHWARNYLRKEKFRQPKPKPKKAEESVRTVSRLKPVPLVSQALPPPAPINMRYPDFVRPLPPTLAMLILRGADEEASRGAPSPPAGEKAAAD